jgi:hypothetical protein
MWWEEESRVLGMRRARRHNVLAAKSGDKSLIAVSKCMVHRGLEEEFGLNCAYELLQIGWGNEVFRRQQSFVEGCTSYLS